MAGRKRQRKNAFAEVLRLIVMTAALAVLIYSAWQLYSIYHGYRAAGQEYERLAEEFTAPGGSASGDPAAPDTDRPGSEDAAEPDQSAAESGEERGFIEDAEPPLVVDWKALGEVNSDIIGWLYVEAQPSISYPICQGTDNDYYLHRTFRREEIFAGAIFADYLNSPDFSDPNTIVYGHNMKNGSMFGMLKFIKAQETYDAAPYFWILTPEGNYRYHIYAAMNTPVDSEVYTFFDGRGETFLAWEKQMQAASEAVNDVPLSENDYTVTLSTCTSDSSYRCVVMGKLVSSSHPKK